MPRAMRPYKSEKCVCGKLVSAHTFPAYQRHMEEARAKAQAPEPDYGGAFDGHTVSSDADRGL